MPTDAHDGTAAWALSVDTATAPIVIASAALAAAATRRAAGHSRRLRGAKRVITL